MSPDISTANNTSMHLVSISMIMEIQQWSKIPKKNKSKKHSYILMSSPHRLQKAQQKQFQQSSSWPQKQTPDQNWTYKDQVYHPLRIHRYWTYHLPFQKIMKETWISYLSASFLLILRIKCSGSWNLCLALLEDSIWRIL